MMEANDDISWLVGQLTSKSAYEGVEFSKLLRTLEASLTYKGLTTDFGIPSAGGGDPAGSTAGPTAEETTR